MNSHIPPGRFVWIGAILALFLLTALVLLGAEMLHSRSTATQSSLTTEEYWSEAIASKGGKAASDEMLRIGYSRTAAEAHLLAHTFGAALYDGVGVDGLSACPSEFSYGCAHELIGKTIGLAGLAAIEGLFRTCESADVSKNVCMHSVGHGILGYFGYDTVSLTSALEVCRAYEEDARGGCGDGVFMEYFLRFMATIGGDEDSTRPIDERHPYAPCLSVGDWYGTSCAFELPRRKLYAERTDAIDLHAQFADIGVYCGALQDARLLRACFEGVGALAAIEVKQNLGASLQLCRQAAVSSQQYVYCTTGIVLHLHYWNVSGYEAVCRIAELNDEDLAYCEAYARADVRKVDALPMPTGSGS